VLDRDCTKPVELTLENNRDAVWEFTQVGPIYHNGDGEEETTEEHNRAAENCGGLPAIEYHCR